MKIKDILTEGPNISVYGTALKRVGEVLAKYAEKIGDEHSDYSDYHKASYYATSGAIHKLLKHINDLGYTPKNLIIGQLARYLGKKTALDMLGMSADDPEITQTNVSGKLDLASKLNYVNNQTLVEESPFATKPYKGWSYNWEWDKEYNEEGELVTNRILHSATNEAGKVVKIDFEPWATMAQSDFETWIDLGMKDRKAFNKIGPITDTELQKAAMYLLKARGVRKDDFPDTYKMDDEGDTAVDHPTRSAEDY
jgi:hypothetical protein